MEREELIRRSEISSYNQKKKKIDITSEAWRSAMKDIKGSIKVKASHSNSEDERDSPKA
jgi:hypothetical protein